ncbi:MAG: hypothetical protein PHE89_02025 [Alphaproteobacteria bacterium]|nr:hypothetical protein [Alphaproteobacteria bacterium]
MKKLVSRLSSLSLSLLLLNGCAFSNDTLFPSSSKSAETKPAMTTSGSSRLSSKNTNLPNLGTSNFSAVDISQGKATGTFVGQKVIAFRSELTSLQGSVNKHNSDLQNIRHSAFDNASKYSDSINLIETKLQAGTTPGNPYVVAALQSAQGSVQSLNEDAILLNQLSTRVASDLVTTSYILNSIQTAYTVSGAVDEDHAQLKALQKDAEATSTTLSNILNEINSDYSRQQQYVLSANQTIDSLAGPVRVGNFSGGFVKSVPTTPVQVSPLETSYLSNNSTSSTVKSPVNTGFSTKPLFVAKFNKSNVDYKDGLNRAIAGGLKAKPDMIFDIVAVTPTEATSADRSKARNYATEVFEQVVEVGVNPENVALSAKSSATAEYPEVHIYIK